MQNLKSTCTKCTKEYKHNIIDTKYFFLKNKTNLCLNSIFLLMFIINLYIMFIHFTISINIQIKNVTKLKYLYFNKFHMLNVVHN